MLLIEEVEQKVEEVLEKDFKGALNGYSRKEVDIFLDGLVEFYEHIINRLIESEKEEDTVIRENLRLKNHVIKLEQQVNEIKKSQEFDKIILKQKINDMTQELSRLKGHR